MDLDDTDDLVECTEPEDIEEQPASRLNDRTVIDPTRRKRRASRMETRDWARLLADAGESPAGRSSTTPSAKHLLVHLTTQSWRS